MRALLLSPISLRKNIAVLVVGLFAALTFVALPSNSAQAVAPTRTKADKVTICHRTHAVTNPYRMITVSTNSVDGDLHNPVSGNEPNGGGGDHAGYVHNKVTQGSGQNPDVHTAPSVSDLFDPNYTYPANQKIWEDIIPPFTVTRNNTVLKYPGMNWTAIGKAIYYGQTYNNVDYSGLCGSMGAKEFAQKEYDEWLADFPGQNGGRQPNDTEKTNKKQEIVNDVKDQADVNEGPFTGSENMDNLPSEPVKPKGPNKPSDLTTLQNNIDTNNTNNPNSIKQALAGLVWKDLNRNGVQDGGEGAFQNVSISVVDPSSNTPIQNLGLANNEYSLVSYSTSVSNDNVFSFATFSGNAIFRTVTPTTVTVTTDANGYFQVPLLPDGEWKIIVSTPDGWSYTYDSNGSGDGLMPGTVVPVGGVGFAWAGLVYTGTGTVNADGSITNADGTVTNADGSVSPALANTGQNGSWYIFGVVGIELIATGALLLWLRRKSSRPAQR